LEEKPLSRWTWAAMLAVAACVLWVDLSRFEDPVGERYVSVMAPGAADFAMSYLGARALTMGLDPYRNDLAELKDPWGREETFDGVKSGPFYPPTQLALLVPLALVEKADRREAARQFFRASLVALAALVAVAFLLVRRALAPGGPRASGLLFFLALALSLNVSTVFGLERGQTDLVTALLCWGAVLAACRGWPFWAMFAAVGAASIKGYGGLLAIGLGLLFINRRQVLKAAGGSVAALLVLVAPVARYLPGAVRNVRHRAGVFDDNWYNHSFRNLGDHLSPSLAAPAQIGLGLVALAAAVLCWLRARRALREDEQTKAVWLALFAAASLGTLVGFTASSYSYNLILVLPGALVLGLSQAGLARQAALARWSTALLGSGIVAVLIALFLPRLPWTKFPLASVGLAGFLVVAGSLAALGLRSRVRPEAAPG
jgi:hypothetical protein